MFAGDIDNDQVDELFALTCYGAIISAWSVYIGDDDRVVPIRVPAPGAPGVDVGPLVLRIVIVRTIRREGRSLWTFMRVRLLVAGSTVRVLGTGSFDKRLSPGRQPINRLDPCLRFT